MSKKAKKNDWKRKRKFNYIEPKEHNYYIFCEGTKTEPNYFKGFKQYIESDPIYRNMVLIQIQPCGAGTLQVLEQAIEYVTHNRISKGQIWCIYDKDDFPAKNFNGVVEKINNLNKNCNEIQYHAGWSNECIEFWFILHFSNYTSNNHRQEYLKYLSKEYNKLGLNEYKKNMDNIFTILMEKGNPQNAISFAKKIDALNIGKTPSDCALATQVYKLVEELAKYLPLKYKKYFINDNKNYNYYNYKK